MSNPPSSRPSQPRRKRQQVSRACDSCRSQRIKCDTSAPCSQCKFRGNECSKTINPSISSLTQARSEIDGLQREVRELRKNLQASNDTVAALREGGNNVPDIRPPDAAGTTLGDYHSEMTLDHEKPAFWPGVQLSSGREPQNRSWHGPSSLIFFMSRIADFLSTELNRHQSTDDLTIKGRTGALLGKANPVGRTSVSASTAPALTSDLQVFGTETPLSPTQEDYFLELYWTSIHADSYPILDEKAFKEHYRSLLGHSGNSRSPSALVDIVLALCMQAAFPRGGAQAKSGLGHGDLDAGIAGRWYYKRCQLLLVDDMESPTIATLQCHILSSIYLCSGSFHNMSDTACSLGVRTAYMLGMHLDPSNFDFSPKEQEYRRRLWWAIYVQDCKIGLKLGRPFLLPPALQNNGSPCLLSDSMETAGESGSYYAPLGSGNTWLTFHLHATKLYTLAKCALHAFYNIELPGDLSSGPGFWNHPTALRIHADLLSPYLERFEEWTKEVPQVLHARRPDGDEPFSTKTPSLSLEQFAPVWLRRQRLTLELMYHHLHTCLCRPFIKFPTLAGAVTRESSADVQAGELAVICAEHATTLVRIYHEAISTTSLLSGRNEPFQWLWSAAITLVGFLLANQSRPSQQNRYRKDGSTTASGGREILPQARDDIGVEASPEVRRTISNARDAVVTAAGVFDILGESLGDTPIKAAKVVRSLLFKIDAVATIDRTGSSGSSSGNSIIGQPGESTMNGGNTTSPGAGQGHMDNSHLSQPCGDDGTLFWADLPATQEWLATTQGIFECAFQVDDYSESINFNDAAWQIPP